MMIIITISLLLFARFNKIAFSISNTPIIIGPDVYNLDNQLTQLKRSISTLDPDSFEYKKLLNSYNKLALEKKIKYTESDSIIISTSRHYYNYRHSGNVFSILSILRYYGGHSINSSQIVIPDDHICCPLTSIPGEMYITNDINENSVGKLDSNDEWHCDLQENLNKSGTIINYRRDNLNKNKLRYIITQRYPTYYPRLSRSPFRTNLFWSGLAPKPNLLFYITGHGGDKYIQVNHRDFILSQEFNIFFSEINEKKLYSRFFIIADTCQASTLFSDINNNIPLGWMASSILGESSYSLHNNHTLSVANVDQFSYYLTHYLQDICGTIRDGVARAAASRLFTSSVKRYLTRTFISSTVASSNSSGLANSGDPHARKNKRTSSNDETKNNNTNEPNLYLGQFIFNYRTVYFNSFSLPIHFERNYSLKVGETVEYFSVGNVNVELFKESPSFLDQITTDIKIQQALGYATEFKEAGIHVGDDYRNQYTEFFGNWNKCINYTDYIIYPFKYRYKLWYYKIRPRPEIKKYNPLYSLLGQYYSLPDQEYLKGIEPGLLHFESDTKPTVTNYLETEPLYLALCIYLGILSNLVLYNHLMFYTS